MVVRIRSERLKARRRLGGLAAPLLGPIAFTTLVLLGASLVPPPPELARLCAPSADRGVVEVDTKRPSCALVVGAGARRRRPAGRPA